MQNQLPTDEQEHTQQQSELPSEQLGAQNREQPGVQSTVRLPSIPFRSDQFPGTMFESSTNNEAEPSNTNVPLPFPTRATKNKKPVMDEELWELFSKVEINIPLFEAIRQIPRYAKFL